MEAEAAAEEAVEAEVLGVGVGAEVETATAEAEEDKVSAVVAYAARVARTRANGVLRKARRASPENSKWHGFSPDSNQTM